jgi:hypothetical protein
MSRMDNTAQELRERIALYRKLLAEDDIGANVARHYLNEIVLAEMQQRNLDTTKTKDPGSTG